VNGKFVALPAALSGSTAWQALSHTALRIFGLMCATHINSWRPEGDGRFDLSYATIASAGVTLDAIPPALCELEVAGIAKRGLKGYGGPIANRSSSQYHLTFLGTGPHAFEEERSIADWKRIFPEARGSKYTGRARREKHNSKLGRSGQKKLLTPSGTGTTTPSGTGKTPCVHPVRDGIDPPKLTPSGTGSYITTLMVIYTLLRRASSPRRPRPGAGRATAAANCVPCWSRLYPTATRRVRWR
jgi:hypothetical protein